MFWTGLRAKQMGKRYLSDVQLSHLYKCWAAELPGMGRWLPHCQSSPALFPGQTIMEQRPDAATVPPAGQPDHKLMVKWRHIAPRRATCVFFCSGHNSSSLAYTRINSLQSLYRGWLHYHINYCCYGNCPKEVIIQVVILTMAISHWAECSSSNDFMVDAENIVHFFSASAPSARIKQVFYCRLPDFVQALKSPSCIVQQPVVSRSILRSITAAFTNTPDNVKVQTGISLYLLRLSLSLKSYFT